MARESRGTYTPESLKTIAGQLTRSAGEIASIAEEMRAAGMEKIESTHKKAIDDGMIGVDGFTAAVRKAIRNVDTKKTRTRLAGTKSEL